MIQYEIRPLEFLRQMPLFRTLTDGQLRQVSGMLRAQRFNAGASIFEEHDPGDCLYIITAGYVRIYLSSPDGNVATFRLYGRGMMFGEFAVLDGKPRSASVAAIDDVTTLVLYREDFQHLLRANYALVEQVLQMLTERLRYTTRFAYSHVFLDATTRIAQVLYDAATAEGQLSTEGYRINATQQDLADRAGTTREWTNKALKELALSGIVATQRGAVIVRDMERLRLWGERELEIHESRARGVNVDA